MCARPNANFVPAQDNTPNLCYRVFNREYYFPCPSCLKIWKCTHPDISDPDNIRSTSKCAGSIKQSFESNFNICQREPRKWSQTWKLIKHALEVTNEEESVCVVKFIRFVRWFGCMRLNSDGSCSCLDQIFLLLECGGVRDNGIYTSWFAGIMTQNDAHQCLVDQEPGTYLVRFSEGNADDGWYSVAIKDDNDGVRHFQIKNDPEAACADLREGCNGKYQLCSDANEDEPVFPTLVALVDHLTLEGIGDLSFGDICSGLPLNSTFQGYNRSTAG